MKAIILLASLIVMPPVPAAEAEPAEEVSADAVFQKTLAKLRARNANRFVSKDDEIEETASIPSRPEIKGETTFPSFPPRNYYFGGGYRYRSYSPYFRGGYIRANPYHYRRTGFSYGVRSRHFSIRTSSYIHR